MQIKILIPWVMALSRGFLGPAIVFGEQRHWKGPSLGLIVLAALLSDIFDGVLARRWKTDTAALRLCDSMADSVFYLGVVVAVLLGLPAVWQEYRSGVLIVLCLEGARFVFDFVKFGKPASYHSYMAKTWGLVLAAAAVLIFATQKGSVWMSAAICLGILTNLESFAMSVILASWRRDVKTLAAAWRLRKAQERERFGPMRLTRAATSLLLVLGSSLVCGSIAHAQSLRNVTYVGGTALPGSGLHGRMLISSTDALVFDSTARLSIPYDHIISYESKPRKEVHVGLLTEGIWRLIAPWPEGRQLSVSYGDGDDHPQVVVLQMSRADEALLVEILKTRVQRGGYHLPAQLAHPAVIAQAKRADH